MNKLLITLEIPSMGESFDLFAPGFLEIRMLIPLLTEAVAELSGHRFTPSGGELLCSEKGETLFRPDRTLGDYGVKNGDRLMLF